jgi:hypothetical protein
MACSCKCKIHESQNLEWFCDDCSVVICRSCLNESHDNHEILSLNDGILKQRNALREGLVKLEGYSENICNAQSQLCQDLFVFQEEVLKCRDEIEFRCRSVPLHLQSMPEFIAEKLRDLYCTKKEDYDDFLASLLLKESVCRSCITLSSRLLIEKRNHEVFTLSKHLRDKLTCIRDNNHLAQFDWQNIHGHWP